MRRLLRIVHSRALTRSSYLRPRYAQVYTFYMTTRATSSGVALTIDDIPVRWRDADTLTSERLTNAAVTGNCQLGDSDRGNGNVRNVLFQTI